MNLLNLLFYIILIYLAFLMTALTYRKLVLTNLRLLLLKTIPVLNNNNIDYWIDYGTLLGIHRDKDIIIGDNDCDICIWEKDQDKIRPILQSFVNDNDNMSLKEYSWGAFRLFYNNYFFMDIYKARIDYDKKIVIIPSSRDTPLDLLLSFEVVDTQFYNTNIKIRQPTKWKELLQYRYTKNWNKRLHKWWLGYYSLENVKLA